MTHATTHDTIQDQLPAELQRAIDHLPESMAPEKDLWPGIASGIKHSSQKAIWPNWAIAASLIAAVLIGWQLNQWLPSDSLARSQLAFIELLHQQHQQTRKQVSLQYQASGIPSAHGHETTEAALEEVRQAQTMLHQALQQQPENTELLKMLRWLQQRELELMRLQHQPRWRRT